MSNVVEFPGREPPAEGYSEQYIDTLDRVGFDPTVTNALIASMASYREMDRHVLGLTRSGGAEGVACCGGSAEKGAAKSDCC